MKIFIILNTIILDNDVYYIVRIRHAVQCRGLRYI
jgi:hypothetical protein